MRTRPDLEPVSRPPRDPDFPPDAGWLDPDEPQVRHDGVGTLFFAALLLGALLVVAVLLVG